MRESLASSLLVWASREGRNPPWRKVDDAYQLAVAEILLQKTKSSDAESVWCHLTSSFPTSLELASASDEEVRTIVGHIGLGIQRTRRLKAMAAAMAHGGKETPGLGPYGSAVVELAGGREPKSTPVDGNIARVITRYYGLVFERGEPRKKNLVRQAVARMIGRRRPARSLRVVYALVDLGAAVCRPRNPACSECPLLGGCRYAAGALTIEQNLSNGEGQRVSHRRRDRI
jgi:A/G-specific adenine glycosylase